MFNKIRRIRSESAAAKSKLQLHNALDRLYAVSKFVFLNPTKTPTTHSNRLFNNAYDAKTPILNDIIHHLIAAVYKELKIEKRAFYEEQGRTDTQSQSNLQNNSSIIEKSIGQSSYGDLITKPNLCSFILLNLNPDSLGQFSQEKKENILLTGQKQLQSLMKRQISFDKGKSHGLLAIGLAYSTIGIPFVPLAIRSVHTRCRNKITSELYLYNDSQK